MMLLASTPGGYAILRFKGLLIGLVWAWLLPSVVAGASLLLQNLFQTQTMGDGALILWTMHLLPGGSYCYTSTGWPEEGCGPPYLRCSSDPPIS